MHTIIHSHPPVRSDPEPPGFRQPLYDFEDRAEAVRIVVYVPGVDAAGTSIEAQGPDLVVTAPKTRFVRTNWQSLILEGAQLDYRLRLRLGRGLDYDAMRAEIHQEVLTVTVPKRTTCSHAPTRLRRVA